MTCKDHPQWQPQGFEWRCPHCAAIKPTARTKRRAATTNRASDLNGWEAQRIRQRIRERDGYCCKSCGRAEAVGEIDHIKPLDQGGTEDYSNLQLLCHTCHVVKTNGDNGFRSKTGNKADGMPTNSSHHWNI